MEKHGSSAIAPSDTTFISITLVRALAIAGIIVENYHTALSWNDAGSFSDLFTLSVATAAGTFVHMFFVLSGYGLTRRRHGLPPQPWQFFENVHREIIAKGMGITVLARHEGKAVSANVYFHYGDKALFKFGASDIRYQHLRAGNLVMWEAIKFYAGKGLKSICFGRTEPENKGLRRFKEGWGTKQTDITYYRFDLASAAFVAENDSVSLGRREMLAMLPLPALRVIGKLLYRHIG